MDELFFKLLFNEVKTVDGGELGFQRALFIISILFTKILSKKLVLNIRRNSLLHSLIYYCLEYSLAIFLYLALMLQKIRL